jgi:YD repeat-containing protein
MAYTYTDSPAGLVQGIQIKDGQDATKDVNWLKLSYAVSDKQRTTTVTDEYGQQKTYIYALDTGKWNEAGTTFQLQQVNAPPNFETRYSWAADAQAIRKITVQADKQDFRSVEYTYENFDDKGVIGAPRVLTRIRDGNVTRYDIQRNIDFDGDGKADYYTKNDNIYFQQPLSMIYEDGSKAYLQYRPSPSGTNVYLSRYDDPAGGVYLISRYRTSGKTNWINSVSRYFEQSGDFANDLNQIYDYNPVGLTSLYLQQRPQDKATDLYVTRYQYDGLGQIVRVTDSDLGVYRIEYTNLECADQPEAACREMTVTDPMNAVSVYRFDGRNRLIEKRLQEGANGAFLRKTTYTYDNRDRLLSQNQFVDSGKTNCADEGACLTTQYDYDVPESAKLNKSAYNIRQTDPEGRQQIFYYDSQDRLVRTKVMNGLKDGKDFITDYDYLGKQVTQTARYDGKQIITQYTFDGSQRLQGIGYGFNANPQGQTDARPQLKWDFSFTPDHNQLQQLRFGGGFSTTQWTWNDKALSGLSVTGGDLSFGVGSKGFQQAAVNFNFTHDGLGRLAFLQNPQQNPNASSQGNNQAAILNGLEVTHCTRPLGAVRLIYLRRSGAGSDPANCDLVESGVDTVEDYDVHGRLVKIADEFGTRQFSYEKSTTQAYRWNVTVKATGKDKNATFERRLVYNLAGDLVQATDETGVTRTYDYDRVGRLIRFSSSEANVNTSVAFSYNGDNQLLLSIDEFGHGSKYEYDGAGRLMTQCDILTSQRDKLTGSCDSLTQESKQVIAYTYNSDGMLAKITHTWNGKTTPDGQPVTSSTDYGYDVNNPTQLTSITDSAGRKHAYIWDGSRNSLSYTDPNGSKTQYLFSAGGALRAAQDGANNVYEWGYDGGGNLNSVLPSGDSTQAFLLQYTPTYDSKNRVLLAAQEDNRFIWRETLERTPAGLLAGATLKEQVAFGYDPLGRLAEVNAANDPNKTKADWQINYQSGTAKMTLTAPGYAFNLAFDPLNRLRVLDNNSGYRDNYRYINPFVAAASNRLQVNENGIKGEYEYKDDQVIYRAPGLQRLYTYDAFGHVIRLATTTCPDTANQTPMGCADAASPTSVVRMEYNAAGNLVCLDYANPDGDKLCQDGGSNQYERFDYDKVGNLTHYTALGVSQKREYRYAYDAANRLIALDDVSGNVRLLFRYGGYSGSSERIRADRVAEVCRAKSVEPDIKADSYDAQYDDCQKTGGVVERYAYDALGRQVSRSYPGTTTSFSKTSYTYNPSGLPASENDTVVRAYTTDGLNLLKTLTINTPVNTTDTCQQQYSFDYAPNPLFNLTKLTRLLSVQVTATPTDCAAAPGSAYTYDAQGRVETMRVGEHQFQFAYQPGRYTYTVTDTASSQLTVTVSQTPCPAFPAWKPGDPNCDTPVRPPTQQIGDAAVAITYDSDQRPTTEVKQGDKTLYTSAFRGSSADETQSSTVEQRTFAGDTNPVKVTSLFQPTQTTKDARWTPALPLTQQIVQIGAVPAETERDAVAKEFASNQHIFNFYYDRLAAPASAILTSGARGQAAANVTQITYLGPKYVVAVDLNRPDQTKLVETPCFSFVYDNANRLTAVYGYTPNNAPPPLVLDPDDKTGAYKPLPPLPLLATYQYDAYNRLLVIRDEVNQKQTQFVYLDGEHQPRFMYTADGAGHLITTDLPPNSFFDAVGRYITLGGDLKSEQDNLCYIGSLSNPPAPPAGTLFDGMLMDPVTGLAFIDGRAYFPRIGRFLQPDPRGIDAAGSLYTYPARVFTPPLTPRPGIDTGLRVLDAAMRQNPASHLPTAASIQAAYLPDTHLRPPGLSGLLYDQDQTLQSQLQTQMNLPGWVTQQYNPPGPHFDKGTGALSWDVHRIAGQRPDAGGLSFDFDTPFWRGTLWSNTAIANPELQVRQILDYRTIGFQTPSTYWPQLWHRPLAGLTDAWNAPGPSLASSPIDDIFDWLSPVWLKPERGISILNLAQSVQSRYQSNGADRIAEQLRFALPAQPDTPPSVWDWYARTFIAWQGTGN